MTPVKNQGRRDADSFAVLANVLGEMEVDIFSDRNRRPCDKMDSGCNADIMDNANDSDDNNLILTDSAVGGLVGIPQSAFIGLLLFTPVDSMIRDTSENQ